MQCPNCAAQVTTGQTICPQCNADLIAPPPPPPPVSAEPRPLRFALTVLILIASTALLARSTFLRYHRDLTGEAMGYFLGSLLLPLLIAYAIAGVKRRRNGLIFSLTFLGLAVIASLSSIAGHHKGLTDLPPSEMLATMAGTRPLPADASEDDKRTVAATTQFFASLRQVSEDYNKKQQELSPEFATLYTPQAFASRGAIEHARSIVQQKLALDQDTSQKFEGFAGSLKALLKDSQLSEAEKQDFIASFQNQLASSEVMNARRRMLAAEEKWASASIDLYDFAHQHSAQIAATKTSVVINSPEIRTQFNTRFTNALKLRNDFNASAADLAKIRDAYMASQGVKPSDIGLKK
jgi:hypothetical protein